MNLFQFFIQRSAFATVLSLLILIGDAISPFQLPISGHLEAVPPTVVVRINLPGANPEVIGKTIVSPLEQVITGAEGILCMSSQSTFDDKLTLTITFILDTDLNSTQVQVQNCVIRTEPRLPEEVTRLGITVDKASPDLTMVVHLASPDNCHDTLYLPNYTVLNVKDKLARLDGVGDIRLPDLGDYSLRIRLDPNKVISRNLTATNTANAIRGWDRQVVAGTLGAPPAPSDASFQLPINTQGRLITREESENIIACAGADGEIIRLRDIVRVELGFNQYVLRSLLNNKPAVAIPTFQRLGSSAIEISNLVREKTAELKHGFPQDMDYSIIYSPTIFVRGPIEAVVYTLFEALVLVVLVVVLFLQTWRASIISLVAVSMPLVDTLAVTHMLGFSLSTLPLFGLMLAIGIVADDAIVIAENIERNIGLGLKLVEAIKYAMREVTGPIIATALVLRAVFIPTAFISSLTGQFCRQFTLTIVISAMISAFNLLTLSPALAAVLLKGHHEPKGRFSVLLDKLLGSWLLRPFNRFFNRASYDYVGTVNRVLCGNPIALLAYGGLMVLTCSGLSSTPAGFVSQRGKQYLVTFAQLPDMASLDHTKTAAKRIPEIIPAQPGMVGSVAFLGPSINGFANGPNSDIVFTPLKSFDECENLSQSVGVIAIVLDAEYANTQDACIAIPPPPSVQELGTIGGSRLQTEDRDDQGYEELFKQTRSITTKAHALPELEPSSIFSNYQVDVPQIDIDTDREKAKTHGVVISDIFDVLQAYLDLLCADNSNRFGRTYQVSVQVEQQFCLEPKQIGQLKVCNNLGKMVPLAPFIKVSDTSGPNRVMHYNGFITVELNSAPAVSYSSGQVQTAIEKLLKEELPSDMTYEWTELTYQQILADNAALFVFPLCVLLAFLVLAARYESWSLSLAVTLIVPMTLLSAITGVTLTDSDNNISIQISLIVLVGLACKNAILIVEFAKDKQEEGMGRVAVVLEACHLRLRPILMMPVVFIIGVVSLVIFTDAGAEMRRAMGVAMFSGMVGVTFFGLLLTPVFHVLICRFVENHEARRVANGKGLPEVHV